MPLLRRLLAFALLLSLAALPAGAAGSAIRIGVACPLTGQLAKVGHDILNAAQLAVDEANAHGGVLGRQIELVQGDDKGDPREGLLVANKLVSAGVVGVIGHYNSGVSIPASQEVYTPAKVVMISPASTNPLLTDKASGWVFRTCGRDDQQGKMAAEFVAGRKFKRIVILHDKTQYGQGLAEEFQKFLQAKGVKPVLFEAIVAGDKDFRALLTRIKGLNPDLLYLGGYYQEGGLLLKQARELGLKANFLSGDAVYDQEFIKLAASAAEGAYLTFPSAGKAEKFQAAYKKKYGEVGPYSAYTYDATNILVAAIKRAGGLDQDKIRKAVATTKGFQGVSGSISFDARGDITRPYYIVWQVKGGKFVALK